MRIPERGPRLAGRTALITGGAGGIGVATARLFAAEGARLILVDRDGEALEGALQALGAAVDVSSTFGIVGRAGMGQYDASKAALLAAARVLAIEEADQGVRVNAVCPGSVLTGFTLLRAGIRGMTEAELKARGFMHAPIARWGEPEEIAAPILWLASDEASFITGVALPVDGGLSASAQRFA